MSNPPTEAGEIVSNNSLFSDSAEFNLAEKPITEREANEQADDFNDPTYAEEQGPEDQSRGGVVHLYPEDNSKEYHAPAYEEKPPEPEIAEEEAPFLKKRQHAMQKPDNWVAIEPFDIPGGDPEDEFGTTTALKPEKVEHGSPGAKDTKGKKPVTFANGEPDIEGNEEITNCFDEPGLLYRIINKKKKTWAFYNDSVMFEIHVMCTFGPQSKVEALGRTTLNKNDKKEFVAEVVVYPGETEMFVKGFVNGFTSKLRALPLSEEYYAERFAAQNDGFVEQEIAAVREAARAAGASPHDTEAVLRACLDANIPFVDLSFPPCQESIEKGNQNKFKLMTWARPKQYLRDRITTLKRHMLRCGQSVDDENFDDQIRLFRRPVVPGIVDGGELGDCWLQCAVATLSESETAVVNMFRHPHGAQSAKAEQRIGAYRVTFNKNGLWRSVVVDNYFPVVGSKLKFAHVEATGTGDEDFEIWPAVLQKAYAKVHGSYSAIMSGDPVHALTDLTGAPSYRFDDQFNEASASASSGDELFSKLLALTSGRKNDGARYQVILTTPGKAPAVIPGGVGGARQYDFSEEPQVAESLRGTSLLPGHAYTVLQGKEFSREGIKLIQIRNPWVFAEGDGEVAAWAEGSPLWEQYGSIARECGMDGETNAYNEKERSSTRWFAWSDVLRYFSGGGVVYQKLTGPIAYDTRIPITFSDCRPSLMLEMSVGAPLDITIMLSNMDHRGTGMLSGAEDAEDPENNAEYPPVMLSLAVQNDKYNNIAAGKQNQMTKTAADDVFRVTLNSSADVLSPSESRWTFLQAREIAMNVHLTPEDGPYYLIPRLMEGEDTVGSGNGDQSSEYANVDPVHLQNHYARLFPEEADECADRKEIPVTIGVIGGETPGAVELHFRRIRGSNSVFENFPKFPTEGDVEANKEPVYFQTKAPSEGFASEKYEPDFA